MGDWTRRQNAVRLDKKAKRCGRLDKKAKPWLLRICWGKGENSVHISVTTFVILCLCIWLNVSTCLVTAVHLFLCFSYFFSFFFSFLFSYVWVFFRLFVCVCVCLCLSHSAFLCCLNLSIPLNRCHSVSFSLCLYSSICPCPVVRLTFSPVSWITGLKVSESASNDLYLNSLSYRHEYETKRIAVTSHLDGEQTCSQSKQPFYCLPL